MADQNNLPAYLRFRAIFFPPDADPTAQRVIEQDSELRNDRQTYLNEIEDPNADPEKARRIIYNLAKKYADDPRYEQHGFRPEDIQDSFIRDQSLVTPEPVRESAPQKKPAFADFFPKGKSDSGGGSGYRADPKQKLLDKLKTTQKDEVMKAFDQLLATTPADQLPDAIENFYHAHLGATGVLGRQYEILLDQTRELYGGNKDEFTNQEDALQQEAGKRLDRLSQTKQFGPMQDANLQAQRDTEIASIRTLRASISDKKQLRQHIDSLFDSEWDRRQQEDDLLGQFAYQLDGLGFNYDSYIQGYDAIAATTVVETQQQYQDAGGDIQPTQGAGAPSSGRHGPSLGNVRNAAGRARKALETFGKRGGKAIAGQTGRAAVAAGVGTSPEWIPIVLTILAIILGIIIFIIMVIGVWFFLTQTGNSPTGNTPQDVSALSTIVAEIELCEKTSWGGWIPATPICLTQLRLGNLFLNRGNINLQGFLDDVKSHYPNFQCGQFVWSAQKRILNWPLFPGNVATAYQWYSLYPDHTLPEYDWVINPNNPMLITDQRLRVQMLRANDFRGPANILPGDIVLYGSTGGYDPGHVAIVSSVQSDKFNISVMESNYRSGVIDIRPTNLNDGLGRGAYILGWWRLKPKTTP